MTTTDTTTARDAYEAFRKRVHRTKLDNTFGDLPMNTVVKVTDLITVPATETGFTVLIELVSEARSTTSAAAWVYVANDGRSDCALDREIKCYDGGVTDEETRAAQAAVMRVAANLMIEVGHA